MKQKMRILKICLWALALLMLILIVPIPVRYSAAALEFKASDPNYTGQPRMVTVDGYYFFNTWLPNRFMGRIYVEDEEGTQLNLDQWLEGGAGKWQIVEMELAAGSNRAVYKAFFQCQPLMRKLVIFPYQPVRKEGNKTYYDWTEEMPALFVGVNDRTEAMDWLQDYRSDLKIVR